LGGQSSPPTRIYKTPTLKVGRRQAAVINWPRRTTELVWVLQRREISLALARNASKFNDLKNLYLSF
jgi:hypothetical protein